MQEPEIDPYAPPAAAPVPLFEPARPRRVLFVGVLFCAAGALVLGSMLWGVSGGRLMLNPGVLMLPVGVGLLRGKTGSQWWATLWLVFGCACCVLFAVMEWMMPGRMTLIWNGRNYQGQYSSPLFLAVCLVAAAALGTLHWLLHSPKAAFYFREKRLQVLRERFHPPRPRKS